MGVARNEEIHYAHEPLRASLGGFKMPKYRPWLEDINRDLRNMAAHGIDIKINSKYNIPQQKVDKNILEPINTSHLAAAFFFLLVGMLLSTVTFCFESLGHCGNF